MKTKILCFISNANYSGACRYTIDLLSLLDKETFEVRVIFARCDKKKLPDIAATLKRAAIKFVVLRKQFLFWKAIAALKFRYLTWRFMPDLIFSNSVLLRFSLKNSLNNLPTIYHIHLVPSVISNYDRLTNAHIADLNLANRIIVPNPEISQLLAGRGVHQELFFETPESIIPPTKKLEIRAEYRRRLGYKDSDIVVGGSGLICYRKGFDLFVETAKRIATARVNENMKFLWVGGGSLEGVGGKSTMKDLETLANRFKYTGFVNNPYDYFSALDIFVLCSRSENSSLVLLENMALENPVVTFEHLGIPAGLAPWVTLAEYGNSTALARTVAELSTDPDKRFHLGTWSAIAIRKQFDLTKNVKIFERLFAETIAAYRASA